MTRAAFVLSNLLILIGLLSSARGAEGDSSPISGAVRITASSAQEHFAPEAAFDRDDTTSWCAAERIDDAGATDWWQIEFSDHPRTVGAIHMKSGLFKDGILKGHKFRDFVWSYQARGSDRWIDIPEASIYADRYQLIFRFGPLSNVVRLKLRSRGRDPEEAQYVGGDNPCLREVAFYSQTDAEIPVTPWGMAVTTWEEGNIYDPLSAPEGRFDVETVVRQARQELTGKFEIDVADAMWIGEFHPIRATREVNVKGHPEYRIPGVRGVGLVPHDQVPVSAEYPSWILHEPRPSYFLYSGSFWDYTKESPQILSSFYSFLARNYREIPSLGACGGHQITAMVLANPNYKAFAQEFTTSQPFHAVVTCGSQYSCGLAALFQGPDHCCKEDGPRQMTSNLPGVAMKNSYTNSRLDMLFNLIPGAATTEGFAAYLHHVDSVNPIRVASIFDIISTYPASVKRLDKKHPTLVQAMKLRGEPVYGTQFHWDESTPWDCKRDDGHRNMERILKNFVFMALSRLSTMTPESGGITASSTKAGTSVAALADLDRATEWCSAENSTDASVTFDFRTPQSIERVLMVEGDTAAAAAHQSYRFEYSDDGETWTEIPVHRKSAYEAQRIGLLACEATGGPLPGSEDGQTVITSFDQAVRATQLRVWLHGPVGPKCLREVFVY